MLNFQTSAQNNAKKELPVLCMQTSSSQVISSEASPEFSPLSILGHLPSESC